MSRFLSVYSFLLAVVHGLLTVIVVLLGERIMTRVFGEEFSEYQVLLLPIGVLMVTTALVSGAAVGLRATGSGRYLLQGQLIGSLVKVLVVLLLVSVGGVLPAAWGLAVSSFVLGCLLWRLLVLTPSDSSRRITVSR
jgi:O-antigen/teichoic acid export membrane protein